MLYLLDKDVKTVKWNGIPLHEASSAIVKEEVNGDFTLTIRYPITDSGIYQLIKEDMLIKAPVPVLGAQLFRIKKPVENDDSLDITAYHISDDIMKRSINPMSVIRQGCFTALSQMVQNAKTGLGSFSFTSDIADNHTFNTDEVETLYTVLMDGKHSIVGTWEGELVRDNFALSVKRSRGADRGVVITTHKNLKAYQRTRDSQGVVTRIHARSTFRAEGAEEETTITVTVDSPLIGNYPYINEKEYQNNDIHSAEELRKWAERKFKYENIDKPTDEIKIEAYELDGQVVHLGDTVNIKSRKHDVDLYKKAIAYEYNALTEEYISITFDDTPGVGGSGVSSGLSNAADVILGVNANAQEVAIERAVRNANQAFDAEFEKRVEEINDGIEQAKAEAELYADNIRQSIDADINAVNQSMQTQSEEHDRQVADILSKTQSIESLANQAKSDAASALARANQVKTEAIADARAQVATVSQALNTAKTELQTAIANADQKARDSQASATALRNDLNLQASKILEQARAQTALTNRVSTVETLADGTMSTVAELSKTVSKATGDIASVTSRTKVVEDGLVGVKNSYGTISQKVNTQTGQITSINQRTAQLESGLNGVKEKFENIKIGSRNYFSQYLANYDTSGIYAIRLVSETQPITVTVTDKDTSVNVSGCYFGLFKDKAAKQGAQWFLSNGTLYNAKKTISGWPILVVYPKNQATLDKIFSRYKVMVEIGNIATDWVPAEEDFRHELATYVRNAEEDSTELSRRIETADGKAVEAKTYAQQTAEGFKTRLESLETYKNAEGTRASQYFTASRDETARQVSALRVAVTQDYVAKSV
ncbi:phage tail spike protein, partial [Streptococcus suis]|uniref:phage tail spike protein n=1 Tax=Streptococcus suis TaxID=1307 RepID=UPI00187510D5